VEKEIIGMTKDNEEIVAYTLINKNGMQAKIMNFGCNLLELWVPGKDGVCTDIVLGYDKIEDYFVNGPGFGCCICPNGNRIGDAKFTLNGVEYKLDVNDNKNNLHSGFAPMHRKIWDVVEYDDLHIVFKRHKVAGECGFPGEMDITITYTLGEDNSIRLDYAGISDVDTVFNPTNHTYFNLAGHDSGSVMEELVWIDADKFTYTDNESIPHGELADVKGTPMDFTTPKPLSQDTEADYDQLNWAGGFDHNYVLNNHTLSAPCCTLEDKDAGLLMEVYTTLPGMQLYAGNYLTEAEVGKGGFPYNKRYGVCFESQYFPNALNVPSFEQPIAKAGVEAKSTTIYKFINK